MKGGNNSEWMILSADPNSLFEREYLKAQLGHQIKVMFSNWLNCNETDIWILMFLFYVLALS